MGRGNLVYSIAFALSKSRARSMSMHVHVDAPPSMSGIASWHEPKLWRLHLMSGWQSPMVRWRWRFPFEGLEQVGCTEAFFLGSEVGYIFNIRAFLLSQNISPPSGCAQLCLRVVVFVKLFIALTCWSITCACLSELAFS